MPCTRSDDELLGGSNKEGLDLVKEAIEKAGYTGKVKIGMDVAASEFFTRKCTLTLCFASYAISILHSLIWLQNIIGCIKKFPAILQC